MAMTVTIVSYPRIQAKGLRFRIVTFAIGGTDTYPTGGYPITPANVNLTTGSSFYMMPQGTGGFLWVWDNANQTLRAYKSSESAGAMTECSASDLTDESGWALVVGY